MHHVLNVWPKSDGTTIDDAEDVDLVMPMYNPVEYSSNYSEATGSLCVYSKDEATNFNANIANDDNFKSFKYKAKLLGNTAAHLAPNAANGILKIATSVVPLKYLTNFWRSLQMPLINGKVELKLKWTKYCVLSAAGKDNESANADNANRIILLSKTQLYVPLVTLSERDNQKLSQLLSKGFKR